MVRRGAAAMGHDEAQLREIPEQIALDELHHGGGIGVDVMRARGVEAGVATGRYVDHRGNVVFDHLLVDRIPVAVGQRRRLPVSAGRIRVQIDSDEAELLDAFFEFGNAGGGINARTLRQHRCPDEMPGKQPRDPIAQFIADRRPFGRDLEVADVMGHEAGARAEDREIAAALLHQPQLIVLDQFPKLVVANLQVGDCAASSRDRLCRRPDGCASPQAPSAPWCSDRDSR